MFAAKFATAALSAITLFASPSSAQDTVFVNALKVQVKPFTIMNSNLYGPGADALQQVARESQFIMLGEDHGIAEVPQFATALWNTARPFGYSHVAVEIGPVTGHQLEAMLRTKNPEQAVDDFLGRYTGFTLPFFFWKEETAMLASIVGSVPRGREVVWGLDQEFMLAPTYLLERLSAIAPDAKAKALTARFASSSMQGDKALIAKGNPSGVWMSASTDSDIVNLRAAFRGAKESEANKIIDELAISRDIYNKFNKGRGYESNQQRDNLMKSHFIEHYRAAQARGESMPKVIVKLGANHVFRGPSITNTFEIGSFLPEIAAENGMSAYGILIVVAKGTWNAYRPFGSKEADKTQAYDPLTTEEYKVFDLKSVLAAAPEASWSFIDLRPLRAMRGLSRLDARVLRLLSSFDGIVVVPEGHASVYFK